MKWLSVLLIGLVLAGAYGLVQSGILSRLLFPPSNGPDALLIARMRVSEPPTWEVRITDGERIRKLYAETLSLPLFPRGTHCPMDNGVEYRLRFSEGDALVLEATAKATGCREVSLSDGRVLWAASPQGDALWWSLAETVTIGN